jgi:uncharacterized protein YgiM (DUF1202 family)
MRHRETGTLFMFGMSRGLVPAIALIAAGWVTPVFGTADGPDFFAVTGVAADDVLNLRAGPSAGADKIGSIPHDAGGLRNLGCVGLPAYGEWERMTEQQRRESRMNYWCKVEFRGNEGWVAGRFLREDGGAPAEAPANPSILYKEPYP